MPFFKSVLLPLPISTQFFNLALIHFSNIGQGNLTMFWEWFCFMCLFGNKNHWNHITYYITNTHAQQGQTKKATWKKYLSRIHFMHTMNLLSNFNDLYLKPQKLTSLSLILIMSRLLFVNPIQLFDFWTFDIDLQ